LRPVRGRRARHLGRPRARARRARPGPALPPPTRATRYGNGSTGWTRATSRAGSARW